jgi:small subunit ribosomal protein S20
LETDSTHERIITEKRCFALNRHPSAQKRARQNIKRRARNTSHRSNLRTAIKKVRSALESKDAGSAAENLKAAIPVIDKAASKGIIHQRTAARHVSRLHSGVQKLTAEPS